MSENGVTVALLLQAILQAIICSLLIAIDASTRQISRHLHKLVHQDELVGPVVKYWSPLCCGGHHGACDGTYTGVHGEIVKCECTCHGVIQARSLL